MHILVSVEGKDSLNNVLKVMNTLSLYWKKVKNPTLGKYNTEDFYIKLKASSEEVEEIKQVLKAQDLTKGLEVSIQEA